MEHVLDLYAEEPDPLFPDVGFDESPTQLIGEVREPIAGAPRQPARYDYAYRRHGTAKLLVFLDAHKSWRHVIVIAHRAAVDFAHCMRDLVAIHYPSADLICVVLDNLSTHTADTLHENFPEQEAHRVLRRMEFHYTPKHGRWLNMVKIEIGVLRSQCLDRQIGERKRLIKAIKVLEKQRYERVARIKWVFTTQRAQKKLARAYPHVAKESKPP
jgi:hypothetical protein